MTKISLDQLMEEKAEVLPTRDELSVFDCGGSRFVYGNYHSDCDYNRNCDFDNRHCDYNNYNHDYNHDNDCDDRFNHRW